MSSSYCVLFVLLAYFTIPGQNFSYQQLAELMPDNSRASATNCTFREISTKSSCVFIALNPNHESGTYLHSPPSWPQHGADDTTSTGLSDLQVWSYSMGAAFFISLSGLWGYLLLPLLTGTYRDHVMNVLVGLSCGSLVTSSLCQLIPESYEVSSNYVHVAIFSMIGVWIILFVQSSATILRKATIKEESSSEKTNKTSKINSDVIRQKSRNGGPSLPLVDTDATHPLFVNCPSDIIKSKMSINLSASGAIPVTDNEIRFNSTTLSVRHCSFESLKGEGGKLSKLAIIILAGDFMNNFMDGISIGASYAYHLSTGLKLTAAISFEEYTHKLGDFAIVFQSGIPMKRVLFWNYFTSCACFLGVVIGIGLGSFHWSKYIFSFASGLFLFIALSNMIPEMINMLKLSLNKSKKLAIISLIEQHVGFIIAFVALLIISTSLNDTSIHSKSI